MIKYPRLQSLKVITDLMTRYYEERGLGTQLRPLAYVTSGAPVEILEAMGIAPKARAAPRLRQAILQRLASHDLAEVARSFPRLLDADSDLKGGGSSDSRVVLTRLVVDLIRGGWGESRKSRP